MQRLGAGRQPGMAQHCCMLPPNLPWQQRRRVPARRRGPLPCPFHQWQPSSPQQGLTLWQQGLTHGVLRQCRVPKLLRQCLILGSP